MSDPTPVPGAEPGDGGVIIIKGGSCEIHFDEKVFTYDPVPTEKKKRKHTHEGLRIIQVAVEGKPTYDFPDGFTGEIRITCKLPKTGMQK